MRYSFAFQATTNCFEDCLTAMLMLFYRAGLLERMPAMKKDPEKSAQNNGELTDEQLESREITIPNTQNEVRQIMVR